MAGKRILLFSLVYYPRFIGGAEVAIKEITDRMHSEEIEFDMIALRLDKTLPIFERVGNVNVYRIGWAGSQKVSSDSLPFYLHLNKYAYTVLGALKALSLHRKHSYDAIWSMMASYNSFAALFFKWRHPKVPFLLSLQEGDPFEYIKGRVGILLPLLRGIFKKADHIQTISHYLTGFAKQMGATCPIEVVPNGVDFKKFKNVELGIKNYELRKKLGFTDTDTVLITTSRLVVKNAVGDVIDALALLPESVKFLILGTGYQEKELRHKAEKLALEHRVQFLGYVPHKEMPPYLHASDIFIRPALSEGFGNSFIEAMAAGIPVIATAVGGIVDFLRDGETGLFAEVGNPKSIAQKVEKLMKDAESRDSIVENARKMVEEKYEWNLIAEKMKIIFNRVLGIKK
jgi:glycosyltransferase involved in cell wall biosynthesis